MNFLKRFIFLVFALLVLVSCSNKKETKQETKKSNDEYISEVMPVYSENGTDVLYTEQDIVEIIDYDDATYSYITFDDENKTSIVKYNCKYIKDKNNLILTYDSGYYQLEFNFVIEGNKITSYSEKYIDSAFVGLAGNYRHEDLSKGLLTLTLTTDGRGTLTYPDHTTYDCGAFYEDEKLILNIWDSSMLLKEQWELTLKEDTFSYAPYNPYEGLEGIYKLTGELGDFDLIVYKDLSCDTIIKIDKTEYSFNGTVAYDMGRKDFYYLSLSSEDGFALYVDLVKIDGVYNYSGEFTRTLAAG